MCNRYKHTQRYYIALLSLFFEYLKSMSGSVASRTPKVGSFTPLVIDVFIVALVSHQLVG